MCTQQYLSAILKYKRETDGTNINWLTYILKHGCADSCEHRQVVY